MKHKPQRILCILCSSIVFALAILVISFAFRSRPFVFDDIRPGMKKGEIEIILGKPAAAGKFTHGSSVGIWVVRDCLIEIDFDSDDSLVDGRLIGKDKVVTILENERRPVRRVEKWLASWF